MKNSKVKLITDRLIPFIVSTDSSPFNYERYLLIDKSAYLIAFIEGRPFPPFEVEIQMSSKCNLQCRWCIGDEIQEKNRVMRLPDNINENNVDRLVDGIIKFRLNDLDIETVKFSGFIGEPLLNKSATLKAIRALIGEGLRVGLFTNGVLMDKSTWKTLVNMDYVHISLDAGYSSFFWLKESPSAVYTQDTFYKVMDNIKGLDKSRRQKQPESKLKINIGYVVVPGNHDHIYEISKMVREAGADSIRFKCDIGERYDLKKAGVIETVYKEIEKVKAELENPSTFKVYTIHSRQDVEDKTYKAWRCENGCFYHHFLGTVGSNGDMYTCDHNTIPGAIPFGNIINQSFYEVWTSERRKYLTDGIQYVCQCGVCPPFGNRANFFLKEIHDLTQQYGISPVKEAINDLRTEFMNL